MPELPEVETIKDELLPWVVGQRFTEASVVDAKLLRERHAEPFSLELTGQTITGLERRGKYLIFHLSSGRSLIMHFRMTGRLLMNPKKTDRHARATFCLSNGIRLVFSDLRRLGSIWLVDDAEAIVGKLGAEPLDESFTADILAQTLRHHRMPVKAALIDQGIIAGIGNMYADEALFGARIHPLRRADSLSAGEIDRLWYSIRQVLRSAIAGGGASVDTYVRPEGELGRAQLDFGVAHRKGQPCPCCGSPIKRIAIRNRGSYFCPKCQVLAQPM